MMLVLGGCEFSPSIPRPSNERGLAIGFGPRVGPYGRAYTYVNMVGRNTSAVELEAFIVDLAPALLEQVDASITLSVSSNFETEGVVFIRGHLNGVASPSLGPSRINASAAASVAGDAGYVLNYLHWCPPERYEIASVSPEIPNVDPDFGCVVWDTQTGFDAANIGLGSERDGILVNVAMHLAALGLAAMAMVAYFTPRRPRWWGAWAAGWLIMFLGWVMGLGQVPLTYEIIAIEPGRPLVDSAARTLLWAAVVSGPAVLVVAAIHSGTRRLRRSAATSS